VASVGRGEGDGARDNAVVSTVEDKMSAFLTTVRMSHSGSKGTERPAISRRGFLALAPGLIAAVAAMGEAKAEGWEYAGGGYRELNNIGAPKPAGEESISYSDFLAAITDKKVERVDFYGSNGDKAYARMSGKEIRIGEGFPEERSKGWSSPLWVARILDNNAVPYKFHFLDGAKFKTMKDLGYDKGCSGNVFLCLPGK